MCSVFLPHKKRGLQCHHNSKWTAVRALRKTPPVSQSLKGTKSGAQFFPGTRHEPHSKSWPRSGFISSLSKRTSLTSREWLLNLFLSLISSFTRPAPNLRKLRIPSGTEKNFRKRKERSNHQGFFTTSV